MTMTPTALALMAVLGAGGVDAGGGGMAVAQNPFGSTRDYAAFVQSAGRNDNSRAPGFRVALGPQAAGGGQGVAAQAGGRGFGGGGGFGGTAPRSSGAGGPGLGGNNAPGPIAGVGLPFLIGGYLLYRRARAKRSA